MIGQAEAPAALQARGGRAVANVRSLRDLAIGLAVVVVMLSPIYWAVVTSLKTELQSFSSPPTLLPPAPTFAAYDQAFHSQGGALATSLVIAVGATAIALVISVPAAHALASFRFRVTGLVVLLLLVSQTIPGIVLGMSFFKIFARVHLLNSYLGLMIADSTYGVPFAILIIRAFMLGLPRELLEAAYVDGAGTVGTFLRIVVPLSRPAILSAGLFAFLFAWGDFLFALTLTTNNSITPISLGVYSYLGLHTEQWPDLMAAAVFAAVPSGVLLVVAQRWIRGGLATSGLKG